MTKLANEIVEIINSRNEYMEKQAGIGSFLARKVVKPYSRLMFGLADKVDARSRALAQKLDILRDAATRASSRNDFIRFNDISSRYNKYLDELKYKSRLSSIGDVERMHTAEKLGILGGTTVGTTLGIKLSTPEPTFSDVFNNYIEKIKK